VFGISANETEQVIELALDEPALSPRELAVRFTDRPTAISSQRLRSTAC